MPRPYPIRLPGGSSDVAAVPTWKPAFDDAGYGVAEATVALGLVLTVVVPALAALLYFTARSGGRGTADAAALVQNEAEAALATAAAGADAPGAHPTGPWRVERSWTEEVGWAALRVSVRRASRPEATAAEVRTGRYVPGAGGGARAEPTRWP